MIVSIGFGNFINANRVITITGPDASPVRRLITNAKENDRCIDATAGRKTKAVIVMDPDYVVLSALSTDTLARRFEGLQSASLDED